MEVLLLIVMCLVNILCFMIGAKVGQAVRKSIQDSQLTLEQK